MRRRATGAGVAPGGGMMAGVRYGFVLPGGSARDQAEQAVLAEEAGWDGIFVWEAAYGVDAWTLLAAMAERTTRVRLGTMLTPLPWRRPWKVASQAATLDALSAGRAILAVGLGAVDTGMGRTGEDLDRRSRAEQLDEGIDLITGRAGASWWLETRWELPMGLPSGVARSKTAWRPDLPGPGAEPPGPGSSAVHAD